MDNTTGQYNTAVGHSALDENTTADSNTAVGYEALHSNTTGSLNTAVGRSALGACTTGAYNAAVGMSAAAQATTGNYITAMCYEAGSNVNGNANTCIGFRAGQAVSTGANNVLLGLQAGYYSTNLTTGSYNTHVGNYTTASAADVTYETILGYNVTGQGGNTAVLRGTPYNSSNADWGTYSDIRIKKNVTDNKKGLDAINQIRVRNFEYKTKEEILNDSPELTDHIDSAVKEQKGIQVGVVAQELQAVLPELVQEESTTVLSVVPTELKWYLVNAIQELSAKNDELAAEVASLKSQINN